MEIETRELTTDQDEHTTQQDESDLSPTDELFSMADNVREDEATRHEVSRWPKTIGLLETYRSGLYDVDILDWEKKG